MKILYFDTGGIKVSIGIVGDHQLTGNNLCCGCSVAKSSHGWIKLLWPKGAQVKTQHNSILSIVQIQDNGCLVNDVTKAHGGTQIIMTPNGVRLPLVIKNGLSYLEHYYLTVKQMDEITRENFMTSKNTLDPTKLDDIEGAFDLSIHQVQSIPVDAIDTFYNSQGDICATKSDLEVDPAVGDNKSEVHRPKLTGIKSEEY